MTPSSSASYAHAKVAQTAVLRAFFAALDDELRPAFEAEAEAVGPALERCLATARSRWPQVGLDASAFARTVAERTAPAEGGAALPAAAPDLFLVAAALTGDPAAVAAVDELLRSAMAELAARYRLGQTDADDLLQTARERLLWPAPDGRAAKLASFQGSGSLLGWLRAVLTRQLLDLLRRQKREVDLDEVLFDGSHDPALQALKDRYRHEFRDAVRGALSELDQRERTLLRALLGTDAGVAEVAAVFGVHRVTASRWLSKIRHTLLRATRRRLAASLSLSDPELDSVLQLIESDLHVSLLHLLDPARG